MRRDKQGSDEELRNAPKRGPPLLTTGRRCAILPRKPLMHALRAHGPPGVYWLCQRRPSGSLLPAYLEQLKSGKQNSNCFGRPRLSRESEECLSAPQSKTHRQFLSYSVFGRSEPPTDPRHNTHRLRTAKWFLVRGTQLGLDANEKPRRDASPLMEGELIIELDGEFDPGSG